MKFYVYKDTKGEYRWYLEAENHKKIADSGEGYKSKQHCLEAINLVKGSAEAAVVEK
jgi:uncharacterized protein YegP (UPF0339 family)